MSCFFVSADDINLLVTAYRDLGLACPGESASDWTGVGRRLWQENLNSYAYRYNMPERHEAEFVGCESEIAAYEFAELKAKPEAIAKLARCYSYQTCEHAGWESSNAKTIVDVLEERYGEELPGYGAMPWGISGDCDLAKVRA